jgi:hypothetical protein
VSSTQTVESPNKKPSAANWMIAATAVSLAIVIVVYASAPSDAAIGLALRATARWSFILFWSASVGRALATLFGARFDPVAYRARELGLSFASAHLVHLALVLWLYCVSATNPFRRTTVIGFGFAAFWTYLLALLSVRRVTALLRPGMLRITRVVGIEYISFAFCFDFARRLTEHDVLHPIYIPFVAVAIAGPLLRLATAIKRVRPLHDAAEIP